MEKGKQTSYQDIYDEIKKFKQSSKYITLLKKYNASNALAVLPVNAKNWENDKELFKLLEIPEIYLDEIFTFFEDNEAPNKTYLKLLRSIKL